MVRPCAVAGFLVVLLPLVATPGASLALLTRQVTDGGHRRALPVVAGTVTGLYVHAMFAAVGLSALVMHSGQAFTAVRLAGAAYLVGLGVWTWRSAARPSPALPPSAPSRRPRLPRPSGSPYLQALLANVLNPKAASVYLTLTPQFITPHPSPGGQMLALATAHAVLVTLWLLLWAVLVGRAAHTLRTPRFRNAVARIAAVVLVALGLRSAVA